MIKSKNAPSISPILETRNVVEMKNKVGNIYEAVAIISKRANQISQTIKEELHSKLEEFAITSDNLEEIHENREQIEISKYYEKLPNPALQATQEYIDGKIYFRNPAKETSTEF
jgi:DNA-directed RNA polymerase subunit K/omega